MSRANFKKDILGFYNEFLFTTNINSSEAVAWSSQKSQYTRFEVLLNVGITNSDKFLDLGCGLGHMVDYLKQAGMSTKNYNGVDINPNYISYAIQRNSDVNFFTGEIYDVVDKYDYIIGSGVFTVNMTIVEMLSAIDKSFELCNKGLAFNFLNKSYVDILEFNSFVPEELYNLIKTKYNKTKLITDYLGNEDFTIYIYK